MFPAVSPSKLLVRHRPPTRDRRRGPQQAWGLRSMLRAVLCFFCLYLALPIGLGQVLVRPARAVPSFAQQTGEPCVTCHIGAFGPQLTAVGRAFKLNGYVLNDGNDHFPPLALM